MASRFEITSYAKFKVQEGDVMYQEPGVGEDHGVVNGPKHERAGEVHDALKDLDFPRGGKRLHRQWCEPCIPSKVGAQTVKMGQQTLDKWSLAKVSDHYTFSRIPERSQKGFRLRKSLKFSKRANAVFSTLFISEKVVFNSKLINFQNAYFFGV